MRLHKYPCVLCGEQTADDSEWPCQDCAATELALEEDFASDPDPDIERDFIEHELGRLDELTVEERDEYERWSEGLNAGLSDAT